MATRAERYAKVAAKEASIKASGMMPGATYLTGQDEMIKRINEEIAKIENRTKAGMQKAVLTVKRRSLQMTPVDTGFLRRSCGTRVYDVDGGIVGEISYGASYAVFVHEIQKHYKAAGTQWKFLSTAIFEKASEIIAILKAEATIR